MSEKSELSKSPKYIDDFLEAVYPDNVALVKSFFNEKKCLIDATELIAALKARLAEAEGLIKMVLNQAASYQLNGRNKLQAFFTPPEPEDKTSE